MLARYIFEYQEDRRLNDGQFALTWVSGWPRQFIAIELMDAVAALLPIACAPFVITMWVPFNISSALSANLWGQASKNSYMLYRSNLLRLSLQSLLVERSINYIATCLFCLRGHYYYEPSPSQRGEHIWLPRGKEVRERRWENRAESLISQRTRANASNWRDSWSVKPCSWKVKTPMVIP